MGAREYAQRTELSRQQRRFALLEFYDQGELCPACQKRNIFQDICPDCWARIEGEVE